MTYIKQQHTELLNQQVALSLATRQQLQGIVPLQHPEGLAPQVVLTEAYKLFLQDLANGRRFNYYYKQLMTFRLDIMLDINNRNQGVVGKSLLLSPVKMSAIVQLLKEVDAPQYLVTNARA